MRNVGPCVFQRFVCYCHVFKNYYRIPIVSENTHYVYYCVRHKNITTHVPAR